MSFDTYELAQDYKEAGFTEKQVAAMVRAARKTSGLPDVSLMATKADVAGLETKIEAAKVQVIIWVVTTMFGIQGLFFALSHLSH
jgi:hypothetical protein